MILTTSEIHKKLFPTFLWQANNQNIYLTFDDGPHPFTTLKVLEALNKYSIKATFFLIGKNIINQPLIVKNIIAEGHSIANHSYNHKRSSSFSYSELKSEILLTDQLLNQISSNSLKYFRPPFGFFTWNTKKVASTLNYKVCMWSLLSGDFYGWNKNKIINNVKTNIKNGSIIVFHDNHKTKDTIYESLVELIPQLLDIGYKFSNLANV
ncbi:MAG: polysaccharide deacetylase family protein [Bacteroidetes bacterium]|nr:polysaccharide deacetylase family protein [Bacteroidota bacterium]